MVGGVKESISKKTWEKNKAAYKGTKIDSYDEYINAGVLLLNLREIRKLDWNTGVSELMSYNFPYSDQDIINIVCKERILFLKNECNTIARDNVEELSDEVIICHYAGYQKPWEDLDAPYGELWWGVCRETKLWQQFFKAASNQFYHVYQSRKMQVKTKQDIIKICQGNQKIVVYGSGNVSRIVIDYLNKNGISVYGIAVKSLKNNPSELVGIPVREIGFYETEKDEALILIAVLFDNKDIISELYDRRYRKIVRAADVFWKK